MLASANTAMTIPAIQGIIDRRILINYRVDPEALLRILPSPFRPQMVAGVGIAGICLIRLKALRPAWLAPAWGMTSENAAHRIAVEWDENGQTFSGVYVPRRDSNSRLSVWAGGRLFPGVHHHAHFDCAEDEEHLAVSMRSDDGQSRVEVTARMATELPAASIFGSLTEASAFFERGSLGYSATREAGRFDGLELRCRQWNVQPLNVKSVQSSFFEDRSIFPAGSAEFDCALLMRSIQHEWRSRAELRGELEAACPCA